MRAAIESLAPFAWLVDPAVPLAGEGRRSTMTS
jgi:hypothetical protein